MHPRHVHDEALRWVAFGLNDCQISRLMGVPQQTVNRWHREFDAGGWKRQAKRPCPRCGDGELDDPVYAYLLGLYLGDGHLVRRPRGVYRLSIFQDYSYPALILETKASIENVCGVGRLKANPLSRGGWVEVQSYWKHWLCLFPQHGPGLKHRRSIELRGWQKRIVNVHPERLLRGLIHSDGWGGNNRVNGTNYPRYQFCNASAGIRAIFCAACDAYGVRWRQMNERTISIARAPDVARLDRAIGPKS